MVEFGELEGYFVEGGWVGYRVVEDVGVCVVVVEVGDGVEVFLVGCMDGGKKRLVSDLG